MKKYDNVTAQFFTSLFNVIGITQKDIAEKMGVAPPALNDYVNGKRKITPKFAVALECVCGLSADLLMAYQNRLSCQAIRDGMEVEEENDDEEQV